MALKNKGTMLSVLALAALLLGVVFEKNPAAQESGEPADTDEDPGVSEAELETYIEVYTSMQSDHSLTMDAALAERALELKEFRLLEQRIQRQERLVRNVRQALLDHAKAQGGNTKPPQGGTSLPSP